jgi:hypothetical protein
VKRTVQLGVEYSCAFDNCITMLLQRRMIHATVLIVLLIFHQSVAIPLMNAGNPPLSHSLFTQLPFTPLYTSVQIRSRRLLKASKVVSYLPIRLCSLPPSTMRQLRHAHCRVQPTYTSRGLCPANTRVGEQLDGMLSCFSPFRRY